MSNALMPNNTYYYSKYGISETEHFEMENNHNYDKRMTTQTQGLPSNSSNDGQLTIETPNIIIISRNWEMEHCIFYL